MLCGLTGGIACGKTSTANMLADKGAIIIDADQIARDVVAPKSEGLAAVVAEFGSQVLLDGHLNRSLLAATIFGNPEGRKALESILHPRIAAESRRRIQEALSTNPPLVVYDAALLVETGRADDFRPLIVVSASAEVQLRRLMARDGLSSDDAQKRLDAQMPVQAKVALADYVVYNDGDLAALGVQVDSLWRTLIETR